MAKPSSKNAYLNDNEILDRIQKKELDAYDIIYTKDTHVCYIVSPELEPICINSKVYLFSSVNEAEIALNRNTDTYEGQIVCIITNGRYEGYIVNKNYNNNFYVTSLALSTQDLDYDTLGNRPIINLTGTLDKKIYVDNLQNGTYYIDGIYKISDKDETQYSSSVKNIFLVEHINDLTYIKKISATEIIDYEIGNNIKTSISLTSEYLESNNYVTSDYVDSRIAALDFITRDEAEEYITDVISASMDKLIESKIDAKLDEKLQPTSNEQIQDLFLQ